MASARTTFVACLLLAVTAVGARNLARDIPEFLHICDSRKPNYEACMTESILNLRPYLKTGVPEYNLPSLEPLKLKRLTVSPTSAIKITATNVTVYGASNYGITKVKVIDLQKLQFLVNVALPNIRVEGHYDMDGKVLVFPITGAGPWHGNFSDCIGSVRLQGKFFVDKEGVKRIHIDEFRLKISVDRGTLIFDNLFGGEQMLGDVINSAINNNFDLFMKELLPLVEMALSDAFRNIADSIVRQFPSDQLFPGV